MCRLMRENLFVDGLRLGKPACLMMCQGNLERLVDGDDIHEGMLYGAVKNHHSVGRPYSRSGLVGADNYFETGGAGGLERRSILSSRDLSREAISTW